MPDLGASTHWLPSGRVASLGDEDADADADVDAEPPAGAVVASVDGDPPHPDRARATAATVTAAVPAARAVTTKDLMVVLPLVAKSPSVRTP